MDIKEGFVVCNSEDKKRILEESSGIRNYIFLTYSDLLEKIFGVHKNRALFELVEYYGISYDLAREYLRYIPYVSDKIYNNLKLDSLVTAKKMLIKKNLFSKDTFFYYRLSQFPITFIDFKDDALFERVTSLLKEYTEVEILPRKTKGYHPVAYEFETMEEEVYHVCNRIVELRDNHISYNHIHVLNMNSEYEFLFRRMAYSYQIPFQFTPAKNILHTEIAKSFFKLLEEKNTFQEILDMLPPSDFIDSILSILSSYDLEDKTPIEYKDFLYDAFKNIAYPERIYVEMVKTCPSSSYGDEDYVFYLGCNLGEVPRIYKDEDYLTDEEKSLLCLPTSLNKNKEERQKLKEYFLNTKNFYPSYKKRKGTKEYEASLVLDEWKIERKKISAQFGYSPSEDKLRIAEALSVYDKIHEKKTFLDEYRIDGISYKTFDHTYTPIPSYYMEERFNLEKPLSLAYSNIRMYFECPFKYYLDRILKISVNESTISKRIGTVSHAILQDSYTVGFSFDKSMELHKKEEMEKLDISDRAKDEFYLKQMEFVLKHLLEFNQEHENLSSLKTIKLEEHIEYKEDSLIFHGYIDKLMYTEINGEIYAAIVDYKTGKDIISLDNVWDGFHLQLPSYMFLLSKYEEFKNKKIHILGIYLQKINMIALDNTLDIKEQLNKSFLLQGYSLSNRDMISLLDSGYEKSSYIQTLQTKKDGEFYSTARVIKEEEENELISLVDELVHKAHKGILSSDFKIQPKRIDGKDESCKFCKFKDVCFKDYNDYQNLEKKKFPRKEEN